MIELDSIISVCAEDHARVERLLRENTASVVPLIPQVGAHTFGSGGKRLRPLLVVLTARLCGYRGPRAAQVAAAVEFFHSASLLHDDVVDGASVRRGQPSANARYGERMAVLVGDFMYARACQMLVDDGSIEVLSLYAEALRQMTEGEVLQLSRSFDPDVSESVYMDVIGRKTASLLAAAAESGAVLGGVTRAERNQLREYGWRLGLAFQLVDDALDYSGDGDELGKQPLQDLAEGKVTLPLLVTLKRCSVGEREALGATIKSFVHAAGDAATAAPRAELDRVAECVRRHRGVEFTLARARGESEQARERIESFIDGPARRALSDLAEFVVQRTH